MLTFSIILNIVLVLSLVYVIFLHIGFIKDEDKNFISDKLEKKVADIKEDVAQIKSRVGEELSDVADAVKEVGNQLGDLPGAVTGRQRPGRKPEK
jgi:hypothetical protein